MTEPTYEELKAKLAELEAKQQRGSTMSFKVSTRAASASTDLAASQSPCITSSG